MNDDVFIKALESIDEILSIDINAKDSFVRQVIKTETFAQIEASWDKAEEFYDEIRKDTEDIDLISQNLLKSPAIVSRVKEHIFVKMHYIEIDEIVQFRRLDADPEIVNSWSRMKQGDLVESDLKLFRHEQLESIIELRKNVTQTEAHKLTLQSGYDWNPDEAYNGNSSNSEDS